MPRMHQTDSSKTVRRRLEIDSKGKAKTDSVDVWSYGVDIFEQFGEVRFLQISENVKLWATFVDASRTIQTVRQRKASRKYCLTTVARHPPMSCTVEPAML